MPALALLGCCLVSLHFLCDIPSGHPVYIPLLREDPRYICAVGFEPNPNHAAPLKEVEEAFAECGWRARFFTETAVSNYTGTTQFFTDNAMGYKVEMRAQGATVLDIQTSSL